MANTVDLYVDGLNEVLRAFRNLPKEASNELRNASTVIAERHMVPAWRTAALYGAGVWGQKISDSVRVRRDRVPAVQIGSNRKAFSGGATPTMVRAPSNLGPAGRWYAKPEGERSFAPFEQTDWMSHVRAYQPAAIREWGQAVDRIVAKWQAL